MKSIFSWRRFSWVLGGIAALISLIIAVWMIVGGPVTVLRVLRYGDTQIDDFQHYPARTLAASPAPFHFAEAVNGVPARVPFPFPAGSATDLNALLAENDTIAFLVLKDDRLIYERYYQGHGPASRSQSFSMAKSFTSMLVGTAIADGYLQSVEQPVTDFIPELAEKGFSDVRIAHLLTMTSGSTYVENDNPFGIHVILNYTPALEQEILGFQIEDAPGSVWRYKSGDNALLALVLARALAPKTISEYTQERLWTPLGMEYDGLWSLDHADDDGAAGSAVGGLEKTWCCMAAAARDYLKLGRLYLHQGRWEGQQVIPADWVRASTQVEHIPPDAWDADYRHIGVRNYGYQWWLVSAEAGSYLANGKDGQYLYVNPAANTVILRLGWSNGDLPLSQWLGLFDHLSTQGGN